MLVGNTAIDGGALYIAAGTAVFSMCNFTTNTARVSTYDAAEVALYE